MNENLLKNLNEDEKSDGFVTYEPTDEDLIKLIHDTGIFLNLKGLDLKGYIITSSTKVGREIPFFREMIDEMEKMDYDGKSIREYNYGILVQINISKKYRRGTTFFRLHTYAQENLKKLGFELAIGEVADDNPNSLEVHKNFADVGTYKAESGRIWHILVGDLRED